MLCALEFHKWTCVDLVLFSLVSCWSSPLSWLQIIFAVCLPSPLLAGCEQLLASMLAHESSGARLSESQAQASSLCYLGHCLETNCPLLFPPTFVSVLAAPASSLEPLSWNDLGWSLVPKLGWLHRDQFFSMIKYVPERCVCNPLYAGHTRQKHGAAEEVSVSIKGKGWCLYLVFVIIAYLCVLEWWHQYAGIFFQ